MGGEQHGSQDARRRLGLEGRAPATTAAPCLTCGHGKQRHDIDCCWELGCNCTKFEPTEGGDAYADQRLDPHRESQGTHVTGPAGASATTPAGPDLQRAIQATEKALRQVQPQGHWPDVARIAVEAAAPVLLQAARDRYADLAVYTAEVRDLLDRARMFMPWPTPTNPKLARLHTEIAAALQIDPPTRGRDLKAKVERLEAVAEAARAWLQSGIREAQDAEGRLSDAVLALDQGEVEQ